MMQPFPAPDHHRRLTFLWLAVVLFTTPAPGYAGMFGVGYLMQILAHVETHEAVFTEKKSLALLAEPLLSSGTLRYRRPDYVERITLKPQYERFLYEKGTITIEADGRQRQLRAQNQPALAALIESVRATLAGDEEALRRYYTLQVSGTAKKWVIEMTPTEPDVGKRIRWIRISGAQDRLQQVEILETSDDRTVMTIDTIRH